jgi:hypothetical protein
MQAIAVVIERVQSGRVGILDSGAATQASLGLAAAELSLNQAHLVGVVQTGIDYG